MKAKKTVLTLLFATSGLAIGGLSFALIRNGSLNEVRVHGDPVTYSSTLNSSNRPAELTASFQNNFKGTVKTALGNDINLSFVNARSADGVFAQLAGHGKIYNYAQGNTKLTGIEGVTFEGQGTLLFKPAIAYGSNGAAVYPEITPITVAAGAGKVDVPVCDYFEIEAADGGAAIQNLTFTYSCDKDATDVKMVNGVYTGVGSDTYTWKATVVDGVATLERLDASTPFSLTGSVAMLSKTRAKLTYVYMTYNVYYTMDYDGHSFTFVEKTDDVGGAVASQVPTINLNRVYQVENFEKYTADGQGYTNSTTKYQTTGLRAAYFADYWTGSNSDEIRGSGWQVMTSTDNITYRSVGGHNNSKMGVFKFSNGTSMSYLSMNEVYGVKAMAGKGAKISFWTSGAYKDLSFGSSSKYSKDVDGKLYAYYKSPLIASEQEAYAAEEFPFTFKAGTEWEQHVFDLSADGRVYYGFGLKFKQSTGANVYVPIDDVEIYTADPRAEYVAEIVPTSVTVSPKTETIEVNKTVTLTATVAPDNATNKNVTWTSSDEAVAVVSSAGVVTGKSAGEATITATTVSGSKTDTATITVTPASKSYPEGTYRAVLTALGNNYDLVLAIGNATNGMISVKLSNTDVGATDIVFDNDTKNFTIHTTGNFSGYSYGDICGHYDGALDKITNIECKGDVGAAVTDNGKIEAARIEIQFDCEGTTAELQSQFKRRYRPKGGNWAVDTGNADRIQHESTFVSGEGALSIRPCGSSYDAYGLSLQDDFATAQPVKNIGFWVYNSGSSDIAFRTYLYKSAGLTNHYQIGTMTAKASQWTYCVMGFGSQTGYGAIYNFNLSVWTADNANGMSVRLIFDNIVLF